MKIYHDLKNINDSLKVVTLGNFDGVHKGHQELISKAVMLGEKHKMESYVLSFYPHPRSYFKKDLKYINTLEEKKKNIEKLKADALVFLEFDEHIANLSKEAFVEEILHKKMKAKLVVVGFDFLFGKDREGNADSLIDIAKLFDIQVYVLPPVTVEGQRVSSSSIRKMLLKGEVEKAKKFSGYFHEISGDVILGRQLGRSIGFPTANVDYDKEQLVPGNGVYGVTVFLNDKYYDGIANIGCKPTVKEDDFVEIEVHILNYNEVIYGKKISVYFIGKIRDEIKFPSLDELKKQIDDDIKMFYKNILPKRG